VTSAADAVLTLLERDELFGPSVDARGGLVSCSQEAAALEGALDRAGIGWEADGSSLTAEVGPPFRATNDQTVPYTPEKRTVGVPLACH
jgi:hypothetical protein